jgi:uncharacterized protein YciI
MKHFLLVYELADDYLARRAEFREAHLGMAWAAHESGELVVGGAFTDPADTALLLFKAETKDVVERFAKSDPYVINGLVKNWKVREWNTVAGAMAINPVKPG